MRDDGVGTVTYTSAFRRDEHSHNTHDEGRISGLMRRVPKLEGELLRGGVICPQSRREEQE